MSCDPSKTCAVCDQRGLPILPLRYAVARCDEAISEPAPRLQAPFGFGITDLELPADQAQYTLRTLRAGYLYVFNEVRGEWKAYVVNDDAYLLEFDIRSKSPPDIGDAQPCARMQFAASARCIMIPDAANAGAIWFGFSDTAWTEAVWKRHGKEDYRKRHMQRVDVAAWAAAKTLPTPQPHMQRLDKATELVAEFALPPPAEIPLSPEEVVAHDTAEAHKPVEERTVLLPSVTIKPYPALDYSLHDYRNAQRSAGQLFDAAKLAAGDFTPAMVAVNDAVGITMELATLMAVRLQWFMTSPELAHPLASATLVKSLEDAIRNQGELARIRAEQTAEVRKLEYWRSIPYYSGGEGIMDMSRVHMEQKHRDQMRSDHAYRTAWHAKTADARQRAADRLTTKDLTDASDSAWRRYSGSLHEGQPEAWLESTYKTRLEEFDQRCLVPLASVHKAWMQSHLLLEVLDCNHDETSPRSGEGFADVVLLCIQDTQQNKICFDLYADWLRAGTIERGNLVMRAIQYNQKEIIDRINATVPGLKKGGLPDLPWTGLIKLYDNAEAQVGQNGNAAARIVVAVAGPGFRALDAYLDDTVGAFLVSLGIMWRAPVTHVRHVGTVDQAIDTFVQMARRTNPAFAEIDLGLMKQHFEIKSRGIRQTRQRRTAKGQFGLSEVDMRIDRFRLGEITTAQVRASPQAALDAASDALLHMDDWPKNGMARWKALMNGSLKLGFVQSFVQLWNLHRLGQELDKATASERTPTQWKYHAAVMGAVGGVLELADTAIANSYKIGGGLSRLNGMFAKFVRFGARALGAGAAIITAVLDAGNALAQARSGNRGVAVLYGISAGVGITSFLLLAGWLGSWTVLGLAATGWGLVLLAVFIGVGLLIEYLKEDALEQWLSQCWFGDGQRFTDLEAELDAFRQVTEKRSEQDGAASELAGSSPSFLSRGNG